MKSTIVVAGLAGLIVFGQGCGDESSGPEASSVELLPPTEAQLVESSGDFGFTLLRKIHAAEAPGANIFISPLSITMALGMLYNSADGTTKEAMEETLALEGLSTDEINTSYRHLMDTLRGRDPAVQFTIANSIWYRDGFTVYPDFVSTCQTSFDAEVSSLDFSSPGATDEINSWVSDATKGLIPTIIDAIRPDHMIFLINAIYFKGAWTARFNPEYTRLGEFYLANGEVVEVPMMYGGGRIDFESYWAEEDGVSIIDLPYGSGAYSMTFLVPMGDVDQLVERLDAELWERLVAGLAAERMEFMMPKFTMEYDNELLDDLDAMGMTVAFGGDANFSKMTPEPLYISEVKHKTYLEVNEEGTVAAAATSAGGSLLSRSMKIINRPFVVAIRERHSGTILFLGVIQDPSL